MAGGRRHILVIEADIIPINKLNIERVAHWPENILSYNNHPPHDIGTWYHDCQSLLRLERAVNRGMWIALLLT